MKPEEALAALEQQWQQKAPTYEDSAASAIDAWNINMLDEGKPFSRAALRRRGFPDPALDDEPPEAA